MAHLKSIILSERSQTQTTTTEWFHFYKMLKSQSHSNWKQISRFQDPSEEEETDPKASQRKFPSEGDVLCHDYRGGSWLLIQFSSVTQSCPTLCDPMNRNTPGLPIHHQLPEFTQTHIHRVGDAMQPSHPLLSLSPPALNPSQYEGLFKWVYSSH